MRLAVSYVAVKNGPLTTDLAARFVATWALFPPGIEHDTYVICNGGALQMEQALLFLPMNAQMFVRSNDGWDIGGEIELSKGPCKDYDLVLYCGESVHFHQSGWMKRFVDAATAFGPGMYGAFASYLVRPHLNTSCYASFPKLLASYPKRVVTHQDRYEYEHGRDCFWKHVEKRRGVAKLVTWDGVWSMPQWRTPQNILWRGDQSNCLVFCNHTDRYAGLTDSGKRNWEGGADTLRPDNRVPALEPWRR